METTPVASVRAFNRIVTERIGALTDRFLGRDRPLGESRTLWEIGTSGRGIEIRELRARLGLDSGYTSRVLRSLERQKLVKVEASGDDARVRRAHLTARGKAERKELDKRSNQIARSILEPLGDSERERLVAAVTEVERLLRSRALQR
jgi:DNA-binding MarR family transcriptional regulator